MKVLVFLHFIQLSQSLLQVIPLKPEIDYVNPKFLQSFKLTVRRQGRQSPYVINMRGQIMQGVGNNVTVTNYFYENLSGHFVPIAANFMYKVCDLLKDDPLLGPVWMKQMPKNITSCPFPAGYYVLNDFVVDIQAPFRVPFTFAAVDVRVRVDILFNDTNTKELLLSIKMHVRVIQKPHNKQIKIKN